VPNCISYCYRKVYLTAKNNAAYLGQILFDTTEALAAIATKNREKLVASMPKLGFFLFFQGKLNIRNKIRMYIWNPEFS
jgi:hypothetical protein